MRLANKRVFEALVKSGACDSLAGSAAASQNPPLRQVRARLFASIDAACEHGSRTQRDKDLGQTDLFGGVEDGAGLAPAPLPDVPSWTEIEQLNAASGTSRCCRPTSTRSLWNFSVEKGRGVRFGLGAIKGLGEGAVQAIEDARTALGGRIPSLHALARSWTSGRPTSACSRRS